MDNSFSNVKALVRLSLSVNWRDYKGRIPLHYACKKGNYEIVTYLVEVGSETTAKDINGMSPIDMAKKFGFDDLEGLIN